MYCKEVLLQTFYCDNMNILKFLILAAVITVPQLAYPAENCQSLNQKLGLPLLSQDGDWSSARVENSLRRAGIIMRGSPQLRTAFIRNRLIFGVKAQEIKCINTPDGKIEVIDIIYFNKGDTAAKGLRGNIRNAAKIIEKSLTDIAGIPERGKYGPHKMQNKVDIWKTKFAEFLLEFVPGEFTTLHIRKPSEVQKGQFEAAISNTRGKDFSGNVKRNAFGDVAVFNIPMVDQGPKGYCVPATVERLFRYYGITQIDMHRIADAANTRKGGGTTIPAMLRAMAPIRREVDLKEINCGDINIGVIKKYIDKGIPLMWTMLVNDQYEKIRLKSLTDRPKAKSVQAWKKTISRYRVPGSGGPHLCLIVGYNEITGEIAVSNSWGDRELIPTWVPVKIAKRVSQKETIVFLPR